MKKYTINAVAIIPYSDLASLQKSMDKLGLNQTQAILIALCTLFSHPAEWGDGLEPEVYAKPARPKAPNLHIHLPKVANVWIDQIAAGMTIERPNNVRDATRTDVLRTAIAFLNRITASGRITNAKALNNSAPSTPQKT